MTELKFDNAFLREWFKRAINPLWKVDEAYMKWKETNNRSDYDKFIKLFKEHLDCGESEFTLKRVPWKKPPGWRE